MTLDSVFVTADHDVMLVGSVGDSSFVFAAPHDLLKAAVLFDIVFSKPAAPGERLRASDIPTLETGPYHVHSDLDRHDYIISQTADWTRFSRTGDSSFVAMLPSDILTVATRTYYNEFDAPAGFSMGTTDRPGSLRLSFDYILGKGVIGTLLLCAFGCLMIVGLVRAHRIRRASARFRHRMLKIREAERRRLAADLHDGPIQELQHAIFACGGAATGSGLGLAPLRSELSTVTRSLRDLCSDLRPPILAHFGLPDAIDSLVNRYTTRYPGLAIHLHVTAAADELGEDQQLAVFRIIQESLSNIIRHARARNVWISVARETSMRRHSLSVTVRDDGRGFSPPPGWVHMEEQGHLGLSLMTQRAESVGGTIRIDAAPGRGTAVRARLPLGMATQTRERVRRPMPRMAETM